MSTCHILDAQPGAECSASEQCGVDGASCRRRRCSEHGFCITPEQVSADRQPHACMRCDAVLCRAALQC